MSKTPFFIALLTSFICVLHAAAADTATQWHELVQKPEIAYVMSNTVPGQTIMKSVLNTTDCSPLFLRAESQLQSMSKALFGNDQFEGFREDLMMRIQALESNYREIASSHTGSRMDRALLLRMLAYHYLVLKPAPKGLAKLFKRNRNGLELNDMPDAFTEVQISVFLSEAGGNNEELATLQMLYEDVISQYKRVNRNMEGFQNTFEKLGFSPAYVTSKSFEMQWIKLALSLHKLMTGTEMLLSASLVEQRLGNGQEAQRVFERLIPALKSLRLKFSEFKLYHPTEYAQSVINHFSVLVTKLEERFTLPSSHL